MRHAARSLKLMLTLLMVAWTATPLLAQVGGTPGPSGGAAVTPGGIFTSSSTGPTGCTTPAWSFTGATGTGLCALASTSSFFQSGPSVALTARAFVQLSTGVATTPAVTINATDNGNVTAQSKTLVSGSHGLWQWISDGGTRAQLSAATPMALSFTPITATDDTFSINLTNGGAARFNGSMTFQDLTAARTWTQPNANGVYLVAGEYDSGARATTITNNPAASDFGVNVDNGAGSTAYFDMTPGIFVVHPKIELGDPGAVDNIIIVPVAKGAAAHTLTLSSADQTADRAINFPDDSGTVQLGTPILQVQKAHVTVGAADVRTLNSIPKVLVTSPGANTMIQPLRAYIYRNAGTQPHTVIGVTNLVITWAGAVGTTSGESWGSAVFGTFFSGTTAGAFMAGVGPQFSTWSSTFHTTEVGSDLVLATTGADPAGTGDCTWEVYVEYVVFPGTTLP